MAIDTASQTSKGGLEVPMLERMQREERGIDMMASPVASSSSLTSGAASGDGHSGADQAGVAAVCTIQPSLSTPLLEVRVAGTEVVACVNLASRTLRLKVHS